MRNFLFDNDPCKSLTSFLSWAPENRMYSIGTALLSLLPLLCRLRLQCCPRFPLCRPQLLLQLNTCQILHVDTLIFMGRNRRKSLEHLKPMQGRHFQRELTGEEVSGGFGFNGTGCGSWSLFRDLYGRWTASIPQVDTFGSPGDYLHHYDWSLGKDGYSRTCLARGGCINK
jgi:hypothetical protein